MNNSSRKPLCMAHNYSITLVLGNAYVSSSVVLTGCYVTLMVVNQ